ncbi:MAG: phosphotransferase [Deltaproteobacteria bacterium]|nr:phosphotransferase [Deltaproteobacteria bacterium]
MRNLMDIDYLNRVTRQYGLELRTIHGDAAISGSPERSLDRTVVESTAQVKYIMEELAPGESAKKRKIGEYQHLLKDLAVPHVHPPLRNRKESVLTEIDGRIFQITPYIPGAALPRPDYVRDGWRGEVLADFLISLYGKTRGAGGFSAEGPSGRGFSIADYVQRICRDIAQQNPEILSRVGPARNCLEDRFMAVHDRIPRLFCHGDYHVMNVIWGDSEISGVIDWEFCGLRPDVYDAANMIGCIGIEDPDALAGPLVTRFLMKLTQSGLISKAGWENLAEFIIAVRFAWLAEWLRNGDREMIELELVYMKILVDNRAVLFR